MENANANFDLPKKKNSPGIFGGFGKISGGETQAQFHYDVDDSCLFQGKRAYQQDALWLSPVEKDRVCGLIADGMGGMKNGDACANKAKELFAECYPQMDFEHIPEEMVRFANRANTAVFELNGNEEIGGTTFACVLICKNELYWLSTGDSNIFLLRDGQLVMINAEHELENQFYLAYMKEMLEIEDIHSTSNGDLRKLTSYLGREYPPKCDCSLRPFMLEPNDRILICSDGIGGTLDEKDLIECLSRSEAHECGKELAARVEAKQKPNQDNYSAVVFFYNPENEA